MTEGILIALITGGLAIVSNMVVAAAQNSKTIYRIDQLEKKVEKHNNLVERIVVLEQMVLDRQIQKRHPHTEPGNS